MDDKVVEHPNRGRGRPPGAKNRISKTAKEAIEFAANDIGGPQRLVQWIREDRANERIFWSAIYPKLLPLSVTANAVHTILWPLKPPNPK